MSKYYKTYSILCAQHVFCLRTADSVCTGLGHPPPHTEFSKLFPRRLFEGLGGTMREINVQLLQHIFYSVCQHVFCLRTADSVCTRLGHPPLHTEFSKLFPRTLFEGLGGTMREIKIKVLQHIFYSISATRTLSAHRILCLHKGRQPTATHRVFNVVPPNAV